MSRRQVARGLAWAAPVVTIAAAAPWAAASTIVSGILTGCRSSGKVYRFSLQVCNTSTTLASTFTLNAASMGGVAMTGLSVTTSPTVPGSSLSVNIGPGSVAGGANCRTLYIFGTYGSATTSTMAIAANYTLSGETSATGTSTGTIDINNGC